jgi:hypothetical protein
VDHPYPWLRYLEADALDDHDVDFDHMRVESQTGEHLGDIEGFIVDSESGRPYYVVVDAGGWFKSKHFLLPIGHARIDEGNEVLTADLTRDHVERFPGFNKSDFDKLTPEDLKRFNDETLSACTISEVAYTSSDADPYSAAWNRPDFQYPEWWRPASQSTKNARAAAISAPATPASTPGRPIDRPSVNREAVVAHGDTSPHLDGRAQPGDVVGIETGGERTYLGETSEDENERREAAEKAARKRD